MTCLLKPRAVHRIILSALILLITAGCVQTSAAAVLSTPSATYFQPQNSLVPSATPVPPTSTPEPTPTITPTQAPAPLTQYQLDVKFDYTYDTVDVQEKIAVFNRWQDSLSTLVLVVDPNLYDNVFRLNSISLNGGASLSSDSFSLDKHKLTLPLNTPLEPGQSLSLSIDYHLDLPPIQSASSIQSPRPFGWTDRQTNLVSWYPYLAAYNPGQGWLVHEPEDFGEFEVYDAADYSVNLQLINPPAGLVIAASAPQEDLNGVLHYSLSKARTFAFSASTNYKVESLAVGNTTIYAYSFAADKAASDSALHDTAKALELYSNLFGSYDRPTLSVVEAAFLDGMEYDGLFFLSYGFYNIWDGTPSSYLTAIAVHETAHQWWYGKIGSDQAMEPWLDEAMATYTERIFYEIFYPLSINWWQDGRVMIYGPQGYINLPVDHYRNYDVYRNAVYLNGALFFEDLRSLVGDDVFFAFLRDYADRFAYQRATSQEFFGVLRQHTSVDLTPLINRYFDPAFFQQ